MSLVLTPDILEAAYNYIRATAPKKWKLPDPDDLEFCVSGHTDRFGHFDDYDGKKPFPNISISAVHVTSTERLLETMAHEAVHISMFMEKDPAWEKHGRKFKSRAKRMCAIHGFNYETF